MEHHHNNGPTVLLRTEDYFKRKPLLRNGAESWVLRKRSTLCCISTGITLYILVGAVRVINRLGNFQPSGYRLVDNGCSLNCSIEVQQPDRPWIFSFWFYFAYSIIAAFLIVDALRYLGKSSLAGDYIFGFHSVEIERLRPLGFLLLFVPFLHMSYAFMLPVKERSCCVWEPRQVEVWQKIRSLAFLLFVSGIFLLIDSHNHGYFVLRLSSMDRNAIELLRNALVKPERPNNEAMHGGDDDDDQRAHLLLDSDHDGDSETGECG